MPTGDSRTYYPDVQPDLAHPLLPDQSYFLVKIHDAHAFFPAIWPKQPEALLVNSAVESSFLPAQPTKSVYTLTSLKRNISCGLGIRTNLTTWLPARTTDTVRITLSYKALQGKPIEALVDNIEQLHLEAAVSLLRPELAVAVKISEIAGHLLSHILREGKQTELFSLKLDLNLADLKAGYYVVLGSLTDEPFPNALEMRDGNLTTRGGHTLDRYSYVVFQVQAIPSRGREVIRGEAWGELLQECKNEILTTPIRNEDDYDEAFEKWRNSLALLKRLALKDRSFLESEITGAIAEAVKEVEEHLKSGKTREAGGIGGYSTDWQQLLGVSTSQELHRVVRDYQDSLELTEQLLRVYAQ